MAATGRSEQARGVSVPASLVSIVIPTRNYADYVGQAIRSALHQGYQPVEIIVVDDGSTDDTPAVLREFEGAIQVVRLGGLGVSAARNAGLAQAHGEYVVFLDADDLLVSGVWQRRSRGSTTARTSMPCSASGTRTTSRRERSVGITAF